MPTGLTDFQTWDAFEEEVNLVWINAQTYNEDGSEMYLLAGDFKVS
jgi:Bromodomain